MPDYKGAIKKIKAEMPDQEQTSVEPSGFLGKFLSRGASASTNPFTGNVSYNPEVMQNMSPDDMENTFAHELTHSRQVQNTPWMSRFANVGRSMLPGFLGGGEESYGRRSRELEAFQAEKDRTLQHNIRGQIDPLTNRNDIELQLPPNLTKRQAMFDRLRGIK